MEIGSVVEYIDSQKIICAVVLDVKKQRLRLLTENNREVNLSSSRLSYRCGTRLELSMGRDKMVDALKEISNRRIELSRYIDTKELWEVLHTEQEWIDLSTMTEFCFPDSPTVDHGSAVVRAFFGNRHYFKFNPDRFFPNSKEQIDHRTAQEKKAERKRRIIQEGGKWLKSVLDDNSPSLPPDKAELIDILKSVYVFGRESTHYTLGKAILKKAGGDGVEEIFPILDKLGVFDKDENIDIYRYDISTSFPHNVLESAAKLVDLPQNLLKDNKRKDLTRLPLMTIDGQSTLDYDDAISIEDQNGHYRLGVHIVDVGHYIKKGDIIDQEALARGSSIYLPDQKIPMLPSFLAEDLCSLKAGELRPAISVLVNLNRYLDIVDYDIFPSLIQVKRQLTYYDVNLVAGEDKE
ncbi:RNB domain-containing ribonuclease, partial [Thermodesulfobacteriota bacterium]